jgi:hypothetical protein
MQDLSKLQEKILKDFEYRDGHLYWKERCQGRKLHNRVGSLDRDGYLHMGYTDDQGRRKTFFLHRLIFLMHHGYLPKILDHIDGNKSNNKIENLREATHSQNLFNSKISKRNSTGVKGVSWKKREQRFLASCTVNGKHYELGHFKVLDDAAKVVKEFREKHHGAFAKHA